MKRTNALYNATIGIAGLIIGTLSLVLSAAVLVNARQGVDTLAIKTNAINQCQLVGQGEGFMASSTGDVVEFRLTGVQDFREKLLRSTLISKQCEGFTLESFCMGDCLDKNAGQYLGVVMLMKYREPTLK